MSPEKKRMPINFQWIFWGGPMLHETKIGPETMAGPQKEKDVVFQSHHFSGKLAVSFRGEYE